MDLHRLKGEKIVVYDCEIKAPIDGKNVTWDTHEKMGISVACAYDYEDGDYKVFMGDNLPELVSLLNAADLVVAFNHLNFDNVLVRKSGYALKEDSELKNYDMLYYSRLSVGWTPGQRFPTGLKLDDHLEGTFGKNFMKTSHGAEAPLMYQRGEMGKLISYCLADVRRERVLFEHIYTNQDITTKQHGARKFIHPSTLMEAQGGK